MDKLFDKNYIEMCIENSDLQDIWQCETGQIFYDMKFKDLEVIDLDEKVLPNEELIYYIPRQDELQYILKTKKDRFKKMTDLKFDYNMRYYIFKTYCKKVLDQLTLNEMWLMFFTKEMFNKEWNSTRKEWM